MRIRNKIGKKMLSIHLPFQSATRKSSVVELPGNRAVTVSLDSYTGFSNKVGVGIGAGDIRRVYLNRILKLKCIFISHIFRC